MTTAKYDEGDTTPVCVLVVVGRRPEFLSRRTNTCGDCRVVVSGSIDSLLPVFLRCLTCSVHHLPNLLRRDGASMLARCIAITRYAPSFHSSAVMSAPGPGAI